LELIIPAFNKPHILKVQADVSMLKTALEKANSIFSNNHPKPAWQDDEEMLLKLCGLR
jgi:hypothetical protein